jgi:hypothetical protein
MTRQTRERLGYYIAGVAIGCMLLGMARVAWMMQKPRQAPAAPQTAPAR